MNHSDIPATSTVIPVEDAATESQTKALVPPTTARVPPAAHFAAVFRKTRTDRGSKRGIAILDFLVRLLAIGATIAAAVCMGTVEETLPFFTESYQFHAIYYDFPFFTESCQFHAIYYDFPQFTWFVAANALAAAYLLVSLLFSLIGICRPSAVGPRFFLFFFDAVMMALTSAAAASATAIVYLAHEGNFNANWVAICNRFQDFYQQTSGAVIASFVAAFFSCCWFSYPVRRCVGASR